VREVGQTGGQSEGRRGSRFNLEEGGRYLGIPQNPGQPAPPPVTINPVSTKSGAEHLFLDLLGEIVRLAHLPDQLHLLLDHPDTFPFILRP
jgi:hypothetical protein